jgi:hypothetical protein
MMFAYEAVRDLVAISAFIAAVLLWSAVIGGLPA